MKNQNLTLMMMRKKMKKNFEEIFWLKFCCENNSLFDDFAKRFFIAWLRKKIIERKLENLNLIK